MSDLADLIFDNNSTLFEVLDGLDIPTLSSQVVQLDNRLDDVNDQLRQLGLIVDTNQVSNNTSFVNVNTRIDNAIGDFETISTQVNEVNADLTRVEIEVDRLDGRVNQLTSIVSLEQVKVAGLVIDVSDIQSDLQDVNSEVVTLTERVNVLSSNLTRIESEITNNTLSIVSLRSDVTNLQNRFSSIPLSMSELYYSTAYLVPNAIYTVVNQVSTNYWIRALVLDGVPNRSLRMGQVLSGRLAGTQYAYILFSDNITTATGSSFQTQTGMIPIGGPITMRYGQSASSYTAAVVRITKQYLN